MAFICSDENNVSQPGTHRDGTLLYMAPEAIMHFEFSFASDIWALGCCIYEISLLHQPFHLSKVLLLLLSIMFLTYLFIYFA